ncbi:MAG: Anti-FlhC(2)FlhD(4) factor YdiV [Candidatus Erwinia impunctatus]|nr:Anti-FlhC(2)FlhD(4) factor YdiV [Culicoides impunctatus]
MSIDAQTADILAGNELLMSKFSELPYLELELDESFPGLSQGESNPQLAFLHQHFVLNLRNYGAGKASSKAVFDGLFSRIKIDKGFIQQTMMRNVSPSFINTVFYHIRPYCQQVILPGIDDMKMFRQAYHFDVDGLTGNLFTSVNETMLGKLTQLPEVFLQSVR